MEHKSKAAFDTNILVYLLSDQDRKKTELVEDLWRAHRRKFVPYQVLQELVWVLYRKMGAKPEELELFITSLFGNPEVEIGKPDKTVFQRAFRIFREMKFQYWDSFVLAESEASGCDVLYTEDMQHGRQVGKLAICNPFAGEQE